MRFIYIDESGDSGFREPDGYTRTEAYTLAALTVSDTEWLWTLNALIDFRKFLNKRYGLRMGDELRAYDLVNGEGDFKRLGLSDATRLKIFRKSLTLLDRLGTINVWAIVIDKRAWRARNYRMGITEGAWSNMIERLERYTDRMKEHCVVYPDQGKERIVRGIFRRLRRFSRPNSAFGNSRLQRDARLVLEDPNFRISKASYFVQFADLISYAATKRVFPKSYFGNTYWDFLGNSRDLYVNSLAVRRGRNLPKGIVLKP